MARTTPDRGDPDQRVAVITGASSGIGRATAELFAERGWRLVLAARDPAPLESLAVALRERGAEVRVVPTDVGDNDAVVALAAEALAFGGTIDLWFADAGVGAVGRFEEVPVEAHEQVLRTNLIGHLYEAHAVLPIFLRQGHGVFVNMFSVVGFAAAPMAAAYSASKFGLRGLSEALRAEMAAHPRIHICDVYPPLVDTPALSHAANYTGKALHPPTPMLDPRRVAEAVVRLADHPRATTLVSAQDWFVRIAHALAPTLSLKLIDRWFEGYFAQARAAPVTPGNLFQPPGDTPRIDGGFRKPVRRRLPLLLAGGTLAALGGAALLRRRKAKPA
jgi:short-subunit dehydrogenase